MLSACAWVWASWLFCRCFGNIVIFTGKWQERGLFPHNIHMALYHKTWVSQKLDTPKPHMHAWLICELWLLVCLGVWYADQKCKQDGLGMYPSSLCFFWVIWAKEQPFLPIQAIFPPKTVRGSCAYTPVLQMRFLFPKMEILASSGGGGGWPILIINSEYTNMWFGHLTAPDKACTLSSDVLRIHRGHTKDSYFVRGSSL